MGCHLFEGDSRAFHTEYRDLPERVAVVCEEPIAKPAANQAYHLNLGPLDGRWNWKDPRTPVAQAVPFLYKRMRSQEYASHYGISWGRMDMWYGDYPSGDDAVFHTGAGEGWNPDAAPYPARQIKIGLAAGEPLYPRVLSGWYSIPQCVSIYSQLTKDHPEWVMKDKHGQVVGYHRPEYKLHNGSPEVWNEIARRMIKQMDYFGNKLIYLDYSITSAVVDWEHGKVYYSDVSYDFLRKIAKAVHERGGILHCNSTTFDGIHDLGYWEGFNHLDGWGNWRNLADSFLFRRIYDSTGGKMNVRTIPLIWFGGDHFKTELNYRDYTNLCLSYLFMPSTCLHDPYHIHFKDPKTGETDWVANHAHTTAYQDTMLEASGAVWKDAGIEPAWWRDHETDIQAYAFEKGNANILTVLWHVPKAKAKESAPQDVTISVDSSSLGLDPQKPVFVRQFFPRDPDTTPRRAGIQNEPGWDRLFVKHICEIIPAGRLPERLSVKIAKLEPNLARMVLVTQVPAVFCSLEGRHTNLLLPDTLDCRIEGPFSTGRGYKLKVSTVYPGQILVHKPAHFKGITVNGQTAQVSQEQCGAITFMRVSVPKGTSQVEVRKGDGESNIPQRGVSSGRNDVVYLAPAKEPYEALPLGNGQLGVMVRNTDGMNYLFNHGSFFASEDQNENHVSSGELAIQLPDSWLKGFVEERLSLYDGSVVTKFRTGKNNHSVRSYIAEGLDMLVVEIESDTGLPDLKLKLSIWDRSDPELTTQSVLKHEYQKLKSSVAKGGNDISLSTTGLSGQRATSIVVTPYDIKAKNIKTGEFAATMLLPGGRKKLTIFAANPVVFGEKVTDADALAEAELLIKKATKSGPEKIRIAHDKYWHTFWSKSGVLMHSEDGFADYLENLYNLHIYWMAGCSRGKDAPKFNGANYLFCNDWRSWGGCYWYQNTREMYWSLLPANHPELFPPFIDLYVRNLPRMRKVAEALFDAPGASCPETLKGFGGESDSASNQYTNLYLSTGTEVAHQFYMYYMYTQDKKFLRDTLYPFYKEFLTFHQYFFQKEEDGLYHIYPSNAKEQYHWIKDSITDLSAVKASLKIMIDLSKKLNIDKKERTHWQDMLDNLAPFQKDVKRNRFLPGIFFDTFPPSRFPKSEAIYKKSPKYRSYKSKMNTFNAENVECEPIFPYGIHGLHSSNADLKTMRNTFLSRPYNVWTKGNNWDPSGIWAARLGLPDQVLRCLRQYTENVQAFPQGFAHFAGWYPEVWGNTIGDVPAFDSTGDCAAVIPEMQLQSYGGRIRVYPAWPKEWQGEFDLAAEGAFMVSSKIKNGQIPHVKILSKKGGKCTVVNPWKEKVILSGNNITTIQEGTEFTFMTVPEGEYKLTPVKSVSEFAPIAVKKQNGPKWPFHVGGKDTADKYLRRVRSYGFLGLTKDGKSATSTMIHRAFNPEPPKTGLVIRAAHPVHTVSKTTTAPKIDGKLDDPCWNNRHKLGDFSILGSKYGTEEQTEVKITYDRNNLYIGVVCHESQMDRITATKDPVEVTGEIFRGDTLELFLKIANDSYWHIAISPEAGKYDSLVKNEDHNAQKNLNIVKAVKKEKNAWVVEMAIPLGELGVAIKTGKTLGFNIARTEARLREPSTWAPLSGQAFHAPDEFGSLLFSSALSDLGPVVWYSFDGDKSQACKNNTGTGFNGKIEGKGEIVVGKIGNALQFAGRGNAFFEAADSSFLQGVEEVTFAVWVNPSNTNARIIDNSTAGKSDGYNLDLYPDNKVRWCTPMANLNTKEPIPDNTWTHIVATCDIKKGVQRIYVNGALKAEQTGLKPILVANQNPLRIGASSNGGACFEGKIDEVKIYNRVLSEKDVKRNYKEVSK